MPSLILAQIWGAKLMSYIFLILKYSLLIFSMVMAHPIYSQDLESRESRPKTLKDAIATAISLNPKTISTDQFLESVSLENDAFKKNREPKINVQCSKTLQRSRTSFEQIGSHLNEMENADCEISTSINLYDGGAHRNEYKESLARENSTRASFNTADSLIPNTRGGLANRTLQSYINYISQKESIDFFLKIKSFTSLLLKINNSQNLKNALGSIDQTLLELNGRLKINEKYFENVVLRKPHEMMEGFEQTQTNLFIPATATEAFDRALENGPEIKRRTYAIEMANYSMKAQKSRREPRLDLYLGYTTGQSKNPSNPTSDYRSRGSYVTLVLSKQFGFSYGLVDQAAAKYLASKESEKEAAILETQNNLDMTYSTLNFTLENFEQYKKRYQSLSKYIYELESKIKNNEKIDENIIEILTSIDTVTGMFFKMQKNQIEIINLKYSILQMTGDLFLQTSSFF